MRMKAFLHQNPCQATVVPSMLQLPCLRTTQRFITKCKRTRPLPRVGVVLPHASVPTATRMSFLSTTPTPVRHFATATSPSSTPRTDSLTSKHENDTSSSSLQSQQKATLPPPSRMQTSSPFDPRAPSQRQRLLGLGRHELPNLTLEEKEQWIQARLSSSKDCMEIAALVTRQDFVLLLQDLAQHAKTVPGCAVRAERWVGRLERLAESIKTESSNNNALYMAMLPDTSCYRHVIQAWADSQREDPKLIVTRAHRWLIKHVDAQHELQRPNTATYNAFLDAASKGRALKGVQAHETIREHARLVQFTLQTMIEDRKVFHAASRIAPNTDSFNYLIRAWTRCRRSDDVADRTMEALRFLEHYQKEYDASVRPNTKSYGMVLDSLSCRASQKVRHCSDPHNPAVNGLDELEMMEGVIQLMHVNRNNDMRPTTFIYNILITAWAHLSRIHHGKGPAAAERILQKMTRYADQGYEELRPDSKSYLLVMRAWKNTHLANRATRAAWWLDTQWHAFELDGQNRPTTEGYNMVIRMFAETGEATKAEAYFRAMEDRNVKRNSESFNFCLKAWLNVAEKKADIRALGQAIEISNYAAKLEQEEDGVRSSPETYVIILTAARKCAPKHPKESLALALDVFGKMQQSHHMVGPLEYTRVLQVGLLALSSPEKDDMRTKFIRRIVEECAEAGLMSGPFVRTLSKGPIYYDGWTLAESDRMLDELFDNWPFPPSWTRNIRDEGYLPKQIDLIRNEYYGHAVHGEDPYK